jgi:CheY-like chemotaxis protein
VSMTEDRELGLSLGAADWLMKPTRREDFIAAVRRAAGPSAAARRPTVLVIDDEDTSIEFLSDILGHEGFDVTGARGGRDGVASALLLPPDVIVLDLLMPGVDGFDVVRQLRANPGGRDIPIIVFTAKDLTESERAGLEGSVQAIVMKGHGREALIRELAKITPRSNVSV